MVGCHGCPIRSELERWAEQPRTWIRFFLWLLVVTVRALRATSHAIRKNTRTHAQLCNFCATPSYVVYTCCCLTHTRTRTRTRIARIICFPRRRRCQRTEMIVIDMICMLCVISLFVLICLDMCERVISWMTHQAERLPK